MTEARETELHMPRGESEPAEFDEDGGCFEPFISKVEAPPAPKFIQKPKYSRLTCLVWDTFLEQSGRRHPDDDRGETGSLAQVASETIAENETGKGNNIATPAEAEPAAPRMATIEEIFSWITKIILAQTHLAKKDAEMVAFWVLSAWYRTVPAVLPCLIVVGNANGAIALLRILKTLCPGAALLSGLRRCDLSNLRGQCWTLLASEPNLDKRTASMLGDLTDRSFRVVDSNGLMMYSRSTAIYVGENSSKHHIVNSIEIHVPTTNEGSPLSPAWLYKMTSRLPVHLSQYRDGHMAAISSMTWVPQGLSPEEQVLATALGRSVVDSPVLLRKLYSLLKADDHSRFSEMAITDEAVVVEAVLLLSSDGREKAYVKEIAAAVNGLRKARGETASLSPEKVGHRLKNLGLAARRLDKDGNGLTFNTVTVAKIEQLATVYVVEDAPAGGENLLKSQTTETKQDGEVM